MGPFLHSFSGTWMQINGIHLLLLLGMIFGAQVDVESQQFELYSYQPRLSSMFVLSCLGSQRIPRRSWLWSSIFFPRSNWLLLDQRRDGGKVGVVFFLERIYCDT